MGLFVCPPPDSRTRFVSPKSLCARAGAFDGGDVAVHLCNRLGARPRWNQSQTSRRPAWNRIRLPRNRLDLTSAVAGSRRSRGSSAGQSRTRRRRLDVILPDDSVDRFDFLVLACNIPPPERAKASDAHTRHRLRRPGTRHKLEARSELAAIRATLRAGQCWDL